MQCQRCNSDRILSAYGKCSDCFSATFGIRNATGYVAQGVNLGNDSDYMEIKVCMECGQLQGKFPVSDSAVHKSLREC
jgi:hypothetical protein